MMDCRKTLVLALSAIFLVSGVLSAGVQGVVSAKAAADAAEKGETLDKFAKASSPSAEVVKEVVASVAPSKSVPVEVPLLSIPAEPKSDTVQKVETSELKSSSKKEPESNVPVDSKSIPVEKDDSSDAKITFPDVKDEDLSAPSKTLEENLELTETASPESLFAAQSSSKGEDVEVPGAKIDFYPSFGGFQFEKESKRPKFAEEVENASGPQITLISSQMGGNRPPPAFVMDGEDGGFAMEQQQQQQPQGFGGMPPSASSFFSLFAYPSFGGQQETEEYERRIRLQSIEIEQLKMEKAKLVVRLQQLERVLARTNGLEKQRRAKIMMVQQEQQRRRRHAALSNMMAQKRRAQALPNRRRRQSPYENYFPSFQPQLHNPFEQRYPQFSYPTFPRPF